MGFTNKGMLTTFQYINSSISDAIGFFVVAFVKSYNKLNLEFYNSRIQSYLSSFGNWEFEFGNTQLCFFLS